MSSREHGAVPRLPIALGLILLIARPCLAEAPLQRVRIHSSEARSLARQLEATGHDLLCGGVTASTLDLVVTPAELAGLEARGLAPELVSVSRPLRDILAERATRTGRRGVPADYQDYAAILDRMTTVAEAHDIAELVDLTERYGVPTTFEGRHLHAMKISDNVTVREDEPAFLMVSAHHCREIVTPVLALESIDAFVEGYGTGARITRLVDEHEIWIAPMWNPDGYVHVFEVANLWRKNRRPVGDDFGIDLNRNYPAGWGNACGGSTNPASNTYRGDLPASEPETLTMMAWSDDLHFAKVLDYHSTGQEVLWGYDCPSHPWDAFIQDEGTELSTQSGYMGAERSPSADGEHYEWQLARMEAFAFLTETATTFQPTHSTALDEFDLVWPGTLALLDRPVPLWGHVRDACTGEPLVASIDFPEVTFTHGEAHESFLPFGRYHAFPPPGSHVVRFSAPRLSPTGTCGRAPRERQPRARDRAGAR
ncbi:MAG: M14 family zinc carboxypeptidase, partial [Acidobacteriota bacterium]